MDAIGHGIRRRLDRRYRIAVIDGPNMSNLGRRSKKMYGPLASADDLQALVGQWGDQLNVEVVPFISNHEGRILDFIHEIAGSVDGFLINPAGLTPTSVGVAFALFDTGLPVVEVHFANLEAQAGTPRGSVLGPSHSVFTPLVSGKFMGMREYSYAGALLSLVLALDDESLFGGGQSALTGAPTA